MYFQSSFAFLFVYIYVYISLYTKIGHRITGGHWNSVYFYQMKKKCVCYSDHECYIYAKKKCINVLKMISKYAFQIQSVEIATVFQYLTSVSLSSKNAINRVSLML